MGRWPPSSILPPHNFPDIIAEVYFCPFAHVGGIEGDGVEPASLVLTGPMAVLKMSAGSTQSCQDIGGYFAAGDFAPPVGIKSVAGRETGLGAASEGVSCAEGASDQSGG